MPKEPKEEKESKKGEVFSQSFAAGGKKRTPVRRAGHGIPDSAKMKKPQAGLQQGMFPFH